MKNKNKKISKSLKHYHKHKRVMKEVKTLLWAILILTIVCQFRPAGVIAEEEFTKNYSLPVAEDREMSIAEQIRYTAQKECSKRNLGDYCIKDIMGMAWTESRFNKNAIGDNGASHGILQIHLGYHPHITQEQARDIEFSINWALDRMEYYGYPEYRSYAVMKHNGTPNTRRTLNYLASVNNY
jgi:hypothetical protein